MSTPEPGLDLHEWLTAREQLQPALEDDPAGALPELAELVHELLAARGYDLGETATAAGDDRELVDRYRAARETATLAEGGRADPGDVADAVNELGEVFDELAVERGAP